MANYSYEAGASFPANGVMPLTHFLDATNDISVAINQIKQYQAAGNYAGIKDYIARYPNLKRYIINAETINRLEEETRNIEIYAQANQQQIYYQSATPSGCSVGDVWIG